MIELGQKETSPLDSLREAMGVLQSHQVITGTEAQKVADDFAKLLYSGMQEAHEGVESVMR